MYNRFTGSVVVFNGANRGYADTPPIRACGEETAGISENVALQPGSAVFTPCDMPVGARRCKPRGRGGQQHTRPPQAALGGAGHGVRDGPKVSCTVGLQGWTLAVSVA